jgi:hypothetical protein
MKIFKVLGLLMACGTSGSSFGAESWSIRVDLYRDRPGKEFKALSDLGALAAKQTSKGYLLSTSIQRDRLHEGATFCLRLDSNLANADTVRNSLMSTIENLTLVEGDTLETELVESCERAVAVTVGGRHETCF